jgi:hypothetical protein
MMRVRIRYLMMNVPDRDMFVDGDRVHDRC